MPDSASDLKFQNIDLWLKKEFYSYHFPPWVELMWYDIVFILKSAIMLKKAHFLFHVFIPK